MILSVTFNPALDVSGKVDALIPNEKNYVFNEIRTPGGNGINAGIIASRLGSKVTLTGFLGGSNGKVIAGKLKTEKCRNSFVTISGETRMNLTVSNRETHKQTRLSFKGPEITGAEWKELMAKFSHLNPNRDIVMLGGSLPEGISTDQVAWLIRDLKKRKIFCMVDVPGKILKKVIKSSPDFIKPNLEEFQELVHGKPEDKLSVLRAVKRLNKMVPLVCVSSVEGGAIISNEQEAWYARPPKLKVISTVGAGDSMVGAIGHLLEKNRDASLESLLSLGLAASCATLTQPGLILGSGERILKFEKKIRPEKLG